MTYQREVERKFVLGKGIPYDTACKILMSLVDDAPYEGESVDRFWAHPTVDFVRLRKNSLELTVKVSDKGNTVDRIEENVQVRASSFDAAIRLATLLFGEPCLTQRKRFSVFEASDVVVCLYEVDRDPLKRVFLEVEADPFRGTILNVDGWVERLSFRLELIPEPRSLFQIFSEEGAK